MGVNRRGTGMEILVQTDAERWNGFSSMDEERARAKTVFVLEIERKRGTEPDEQRLVTEVAVFADRADISEELVRMRSHAEQFKTLAQQDSNVGRRLDFLLQEMFREITTIGSKARDTQIAHGVVEVKGLLEKMREQVQNVE